MIFLFHLSNRIISPSRYVDLVVGTHSVGTWQLFFDSIRACVCDNGSRTKLVMEGISFKEDCYTSSISFFTKVRIVELLQVFFCIQIGWIPFVCFFFLMSRDWSFEKPTLIVNVIGYFRNQTFPSVLLFPLIYILNALYDRYKQLFSSFFLTAQLILWYLVKY